jgi:hypothetical protein
MRFLIHLCTYHKHSFFFLARYIDGDGTNYRPDHLGQDSTQQGHGHGRPSHNSLGKVTTRSLAVTDILDALKYTIHSSFFKKTFM